MKNRFVENVKKAVNGFLSKAKLFAEEVQHYEHTYAKAIAEQKIAAAKEAFDSEYAALQTIFDRDLSALNEKIDKWAVLVPGNINEDVQLLEHDFNLTTDEMQQIADRNRDNYTMLRLLSEYASAKDAEKDPTKLEGLFNGLVTYGPAERKEAYSKVFNGGMAVINALYNAAADINDLNSVIPQVGSFMDENAYGPQEIYRVIGSGEELV